MGNVLDAYKKPYDEDFPVVCMDEFPKQLIAETRLTDKLKDGSQLIDFEYSRKGVCNIFIANEPLTGKRVAKITKKKIQIGQCL